MKLIHENCGGNVKVDNIANTSSCGDPECCGLPSYHIEATCDKCKIREKLED